jgi:methyl-accepting chemotaxis protein
LTNKNQKIKVKTRLALLAISNIVILFILAIGSMISIRAIQKGLESVYNERVEPLQNLKVISDMYAVNVVDNVHKLRDGTSSWNKGKEEIKSAKDLINERWADYTSKVETDEEKRMIDKTRQKMQSLDRQIENLEKIIDKQSLNELQAFAKLELYPSVDPVTESISNLVDFQLKTANILFKKAQDTYSSSLLLGIIIVLISLSVSGILNYNIIVSLIRVVSDANLIATQISGGAEEISSASITISQAANQQAASVEESASAIEEIQSTIKQNSDNANLTNQLASSTAQKSIEGGKIVSETLVAMREIASRIALVEEIASQTNLLAVNATIESARAGEHGQGFAVVATEVRKLAQGSKKAAQEIKILASKSLTIAEKAVSMLDDIVPDVRRTADLIQEIAAASSEQASNIVHVSNAINQLAQASQENASSSEQLASTAELFTKNAQSITETFSEII